jgi:hypothetical protein
MQRSVFQLVSVMLLMGLSALPLAAQTVQIGDGITPNTVVCLNNTTGATSVIQVQGGIADCNTLPKTQGDAISIIVSGISSGTTTGGQCGASCDDGVCGPGLECYCTDDACTMTICDDDGVPGCPTTGGGQCGASCAGPDDCNPGLSCYCTEETCTAPGICDDDGLEGCPAQ